MNSSSRHITEKNSWLKHIDFMLINLLVLTASFLLAYYYKFHHLDCFRSNTWRSLFIFELLVELILIFLFTPFSGISRRKEDREFLVSFNMALQGFVVCCIYLYTMKIGDVYSRTVVGLTYALHFVLSFVCRSLWKILLSHGFARLPGNARRTLLVIGEKKTLPKVLRNVGSGFFHDYDIKGVCVIDGVEGETIVGQTSVVNGLGEEEFLDVSYHCDTTLEHVVDYVLTNNIDEVFVGVRPADVESSVYKRLVDNGKGIHMSIEPMIGFPIDNQFITTVGVSKALGIGMYSFTPQQLLYLVFKRFIDIFCGLIGLVCMLPLMAFVKVCYLCIGDTSSIFYTHERIGINGKPFRMIKFRSMIYNADDVLKELLKDPKYKEEWDLNQKFENDPRITRVGRFLRRTSLDEIPQLLNILKGDMSLVGPRPLVKGELEAHNGLKLYTMVKPGLTGWWGCNGRSNTTYDERLELEYYYVKHCSLYLDTLCVLKTIASVLKKEGAK